jgi:hypothetical protein
MAATQGIPARRSSLADIARRCAYVEKAAVAAFSLSPRLVAPLSPRVSVRRHMVPDDGHIRRLDRRLIDNLTITHHQDTVRQGQELVQVLTYQ